MYFTIGKNYQNYILIALSLYVYWQFGKWNILPILVMSMMFITASYLMNNHRSRMLLLIPILISVIGFVGFKNNISGVVLPIGYSVLTFSGISLLIDQHRSGQRYHFSETASYLLFFPKIFAGPIQRVRYFIKEGPNDFKLSTLYIGAKYLIFASFCKFIVSDRIVVNYETKGINLLFEIMVYAIVFFFDFWAYSLMAIGVGHLFGYRLPISFDRPYYSNTLREFWRKWNITLGAWLRDYIYIPLGGNKQNISTQALIILGVFLVSGVWHGTTLPFIAWGAIHGLLLCGERFIIKPERFKKAAKLLYSTLIMISIALLWQLFVVDTMIDFYRLLQRIFQPTLLEFNSVIKWIACVIALIILTDRRVICLISKNSTQQKRIVLESSMLCFMLFALWLLNAPTSLNFFYFRF